ncbi:hypothetical protein [Paenibacillus shirakamiensis]|uniref:hypothetical protein n=1 Tax=Paenibacillus shirakamiensis TaxID=1265935 RepID=UPI001AE670FA|nr:hypothetical protein [Paenibacillus shirakamiensis]
MQIHTAGVNAFSKSNRLFTEQVHNDTNQSSTAQMNTDFRNITFIAQFEIRNSTYKPMTNLQLDLISSSNAPPLGVSYSYDGMYVQIVRFSTSTTQLTVHFPEIKDFPIGSPWSLENNPIRLRLSWGDQHQFHKDYLLAQLLRTL